MLQSEEVRAGLLEQGERRARVAAGTAPRRTGGGADSIHAEAVLDGRDHAVAVGWDREHYYMIFHERGTRYLPARPFLVPAFENV